MIRVGGVSRGQQLYLPPSFRLPRWDDIEFNQALGELRGAVGREVGLMAAAFGLDVDDDLATIVQEPGV